MAVRNFWIEVEIDGRKTTLAGGPRGKDGGMTIHLHQKEGGEPRRVGIIQCNAEEEHLEITVDLVGQRINRRVSR